MLKREHDTNRKKARILVVDDEEMIRKMVAQTLKSSGYEIVTVENADEALVEMSNSSFELALLDIQMPGKSGIELLGEIVEKHPDTAVVMETGVDDIETALTTVNMGAYDYITKPFTPGLLDSCAERALEKRRLIIENRNYQLNLERLVEERTRELEFTYDATIRTLGLPWT